MRNWFVELFEKIAQWLKKEDAADAVTGVEHQPANPESPDTPVASKAKVAIIVGHNKSAGGAVNYLGESEYVFNSRVATKIASALAGKYGITSRVIYRAHDVGYSEQCQGVAINCKQFGADVAVSLHFNSAGSRSALGCEVLIPESIETYDNELADRITDDLNTVLGIKERRDDGVFTISKSHRGSGMLYALYKEGIMCCLVEPCFADFSTEESRAIFQAEDRYADLLAKSISDQVLK